MIKKLTKQTFNLLGYKLTKLKKTESYGSTTNNIPEDEDQLYIEFVGVSGVGKSTLFSEILKHKDNWYTQSEFINNQNDFSFKTFRDTAFDNDVFYQTLAQIKLQEVYQNSFSSFDKIRVLQYFYSVLLEDKIIRVYNKHCTVISEDGLLHNFGNSALELYKNKSVLPVELEGRVVIYCYSSPKKIAEQIIQRQLESGILLPQHKNKDLKELIHDQEILLKRKREFIDLAIILGIPTLEINTSNNLKENAIEVNRFIRKFQSKNK